VEFFEVIQKRYSVRAYKATPVEKDKVQKVLEAARLAPTAANKQPFQVLVIGTKGHEAELKRIYDRDWFVQAPLVICACAVTSEAWTRRDGKNYADVDTTIALDHLILAAADLGLGTCWIGAFDPAAAREVLRLPVGVEPLALTPLGYPADEWRPKNYDLKEDRMKYWRMAFREGSQGYSLWPLCKNHNVAAISYTPIDSIDLSNFPGKKEPVRLWKKLSSSQQSSLFKAANEMQIGDVIYAKEGTEIVGRGRVMGHYKYGLNKKILSPGGYLWPHQIPVFWDRSFKRYRWSTNSIKTVCSAVKIYNLMTCRRDI
jgi:nitroreductase